MLQRKASPTLPDNIERNASFWGERKDLTFLSRNEAETHLSWNELLARIRIIAGNLAKLGVKQGDRVVIVLPTGIEFIASFFAIQWLGAVPAPMYPPLGLGKLDEWYERTARGMQRIEAALLLSDHRIDMLLGQVLKRYRPRLGTWSVEHATVAYSFAGSHRADADDIGLIQFSSGTTAHPKPVALKHRQILANVEALIDRIDDRDADIGNLVQHKMVSWLPLYHDMGLIGALFSAIVAAGPITLIRPEDFIVKPSLWLRALSKTRATLTIAPNFAYSLCVDKIKNEEIAGCDLSSLIYALNGAEFVSAKTLQRFLERFSQWGFRETAFLPVYGLSEATLGVCFAHKRGQKHWGQWFDQASLAKDEVQAFVEKPSHKDFSRSKFLVSCGTPLNSVEVRIVPQAKDNAASARIGAIQIRGASVMDAYFGEKERDSDAWLDTGDRGFIWNEELFVTGRAKDMIIVRGQNFSPDDFESRINLISGVRKGCVAAVARAAEEEEDLLIFVETYINSRAEREALRLECQKIITASMHISPKEIILLPPGTLSRTSSGKIRRADTLKKWEEGVLKAPRSIGQMQLVRIFVSNKLARFGR